MSANFRQALATAGLTPHGDLSLAGDGKLQRYRIEGEKAGSRNGWAVLYSHPVLAGAFGSWKTGESHTWCERTSKPPTPAERAELQRHMKAAQAARAAELANVQASARERAAKLWATAHPATNAHPYLKRKQIGAYGIRQLRDMLVIAARDVHGQLNTLQFISADGSKRFLTGGRIVGCYFAIGRPVDSLLLCEGLATASTLHQATGRAVAVAFNCGNLVAVAKALRGKFPTLRLIVCADNDFQTPGNPGVTHARAAAQAVGGFLAVPRFTEVAS
ncbi:MAG: toprim domain-containing protein [Burkholderiaceae bacterium]|nr:toprim domain-containing protein [Burkholderiaceae bacterium]